MSEKLSHQESSGSVGQMVSQRLSPSLINLEHLSEEERNIILLVLERDEQLRQHDQERVKKRARTLKNELYELRRKGAVKAADENDNTRACIRCREPLGLLFNTGDSCPKCQHKVCKACQVILPSGTRWLCTVCHKNMQIQLETGEWHYSKLQVDSVPLFGSDLVKASLAKARHSQKDPTTLPILTASDLRSDTRASLQGKQHSDPGRGRHHKRRQDSRTSSEYASSRQDSWRSASSGSEPVSVTDSSEVDAVIEPISGFTFQRVSFRKDHKGSEKQESSKGTLDQARQVCGTGSMFSDKGTSIFSDSGLEDSLCSGQTGTPSDSPSTSPWDMLSMSEAQVICPSSETSVFNLPVSRSCRGQGLDKTVDSYTQTPPAELLASGGLAACLAEPKHLHVIRNESAHVSERDEFDWHEYYLDMLGATQNNETGFLLKDMQSDGSATQCQIIGPQRSRVAVERCQSPNAVLKISPNSAFTPMIDVRKSPEGRESTFSECVPQDSFVPIHKPGIQEDVASVDLAYSLNSMYLEHDMGLVSPRQQEWQDENLPDNVIDSTVLNPRPSSSSLLQASSVPSQNYFNKNQNVPFKRQSITDESSSDSGTTPSDESDSLCELELDWDLRASSPDFQEVQLQTKLKKNQNLMRELIKEAHEEKPGFFLKTTSGSPKAIPDQTDLLFATAELTQLKATGSLSQTPVNQFPLQSRPLGSSLLEYRSGSGLDDALIDSDVSSSVSSWVDSDPTCSSEDDTPGFLTAFTPEASDNVEATSSDQPDSSNKSVSQKKLIPRPDWAAMKVQHWKASSVSSRSLHMKRPGGRPRAAFPAEVVSERPVLISKKNKGMYVVNPGKDSDSDSSSDETCADGETVKTLNARKIHGQGSPGHPSYSCCSSSDSELSTILEVSEEDQSTLSLDSSPARPAKFAMEDVVIPSIVVIDQSCLSSTEEDADDEADNPEMLSPEYEPKSSLA
ncbi:rab effector MyRIP-like isoform X2 [Acanthaster planci]|uniref:Rab effector MyRIP-like isoform X2 n=1 Tax=Acanthaster planci TaxID=133434 RepID=A0A8B7ZHV6_ACAPL|nr:rab effector MyRIP-like isoform X2 [Acanthaster planci]XP_022104450.1 rab effector MyRIP-like isoform X2 [Acanthaster planci]